MEQLLGKKKERPLIAARGMPRKGTKIRRIYDFIKEQKYPVSYKAVDRRFQYSQCSISSRLGELMQRTDLRRAMNPVDARYYYWVSDEKPIERYSGYLRL